MTVHSFRISPTELPRLQPAVFAVGTTVLLFTIITILVTGWWWEYDMWHVSRVYIRTVPAEEIVFFGIFSCVYLTLWSVMCARFVPVRYEMKRVVPIRRAVAITYALLGLLVGVLGFTYTSVTLLMVGVVVSLDEILQTDLLEKKLYFRFIEIVIIMTGLWQAYQTARPVMVYESSLKTGIQIGTIPIENMLYGVSLVMLMTILYEWFLNRGRARQTTK